MTSLLVYFLPKVVLDKIEKSNTSKNEEVAHEKEKRNIIDEQKILVPQTNTAEVVRESRKEPALPQEGIVKRIPAEELKPPEDEMILKRGEKKLIRQDATNSKDTDVRNQPAENEAKPDLPDMLKRLSEDAGLKPQKAELNHGGDQTVNRDSVKDTELRDNILKKEDFPVRSDSFFLADDLILQLSFVMKPIRTNLCGVVTTLVF